METKQTTIIRNIPKDIWIKFRQLCLEDGISANKMVVLLIVEFVKKRG